MSKACRRVRKASGCNGVEAKKAVGAVTETIAKALKKDGMITDAEVERAARGIFDRHGNNAVAAARERVAELEKARDHRMLDVALRVLSACERLAGDSAHSAAGRRRPTVE